MNRTELETFILANYKAEADCPWRSHPGHKVFRHRDNRKWFALIMDIPKNRVGLLGEDILDAVNLKCDPRLMGSLLLEPGFFPAYHMNKEHWITVALDKSTSEKTLKMLLDMSFCMTAPKVRKR